MVRHTLVNLPSKSSHQIRTGSRFHTLFMFMGFFLFTLILSVLNCLFYTTEQINSQPSAGFIVKSGLCWDNVSIQPNTEAV